MGEEKDDIVKSTQCSLCMPAFSTGQDTVAKLTERKPKT